MRYTHHLIVFIESLHTTAIFFNFKRYRGANMPVELIWIVGVIGVGCGILGFDLYAETTARYRRNWADRSSDRKRD
jgi:hypothetical protein